MQLPILTDGDLVTCEGCGFCCQGIGSPVVLYASHLTTSSGHHPYRPAELPTDLIAEIDFHFSGLYRGQESPDVCLWYNPETRGCRHYAYRPQICKDYELGGSACLALREMRCGELITWDSSRSRRGDC